MPGHDRHGGDGVSATTLFIAAAASASAAFVVSRTWGTGTLLGAAITPIIVAVVTELLRRPARRLPDRGAPPPASAVAGEPPVHVYRARPAGPEWRVVAVTALAAFVIGVGLYVLLDRVTGGEGRLVPERREQTPAQTVTTESRTVTVVTQQRTVTVSTVTVPREQTVTVTTPARTQPRTTTSPRTATTPTATTPVTAPPG